MWSGRRPGGGRAPGFQERVPIATPHPLREGAASHLASPRGRGRWSWEGNRARGGAGPTAAALVPVPGVRPAEAQPPCAPLPQTGRGSRAGGEAL